MMNDGEVFDATAGSWTSAGTMPAGTRVYHTMTTLADGKSVLVVGGCQPDHAMSEVDLYDAETGTWSPAAPTNLGRCGHKAVLLGDGRVLVTGGGITSPISVLNSAEVFDPSTGRWTLAAPMHDEREDHDMALLPDGRVLVAGGTSDSVNYSVVHDSVEVYDSIADAWTSVAPMNVARLGPSIAVLSDGVYAAGGWSAPTGVLATVERLSWSDLGITGPGTPDGGSRDGAASDAEIGAIDGRAEDAAASDSSTGSSDANNVDAADGGAVDATPVHEGSGATNAGCSCSTMSGGVTRHSLDAELGSLGFVLCLFVYRRKRST
jgi:hypothetical protein